MVPISSIVFMLISCAIGFGLPVGLLLYFLLKKKANIVPFFIGCAVFLVFALILEAAVHRVVLGSDTGKIIQDNVWLYALYGGLMAGLFEETGRFLAFKTVLRRYQGRDVNALMYGAGHGGFEVAVLLGITMINNFIISVMINLNLTSMLTGQLTDELKDQVGAQFEALISTPSYVFLLGSVERIFAVILQISLSVLVWFAAKNAKKLYYFPLAILLHFLVDGVTVILADRGVNTIVLEVVIGLMAAGTALLAWKIWKQNTGNAVLGDKEIQNENAARNYTDGQIR